MVPAGYGSFVGRIGVAPEGARLAWTGRLALGGLKPGLTGSVVAIATVELLKALVDIAAVDKGDLARLAAVHCDPAAAATFRALPERGAMGRGRTMAPVQARANPPCASAHQDQRRPPHPT